MRTGVERPLRVAANLSRCAAFLTAATPARARGTAWWGHAFTSSAVVVARATGAAGSAVVRVVCRVHAFASTALAAFATRRRASGRTARAAAPGPGDTTRCGAARVVATNANSPTGSLAARAAGLSVALRSVAPTARGHEQNQSCEARPIGGVCRRTIHKKPQVSAGLAQRPRCGPSVPAHAAYVVTKFLSSPGQVLHRGPSNASSDDDPSESGKRDPPELGHPDMPAKRTGGASRRRERRRGDRRVVELAEAPRAVLNTCVERALRSHDGSWRKGARYGSLEACPLRSSKEPCSKFSLSAELLLRAHPRLHARSSRRTGVR